MNIIAPLAIVLFHVTTVMTPLFWGACSNSHGEESHSFENPVCVDLNCKIKEILNSASPCKTLEHCDTIDVTLRPKSHMKKSHSERILVIDRDIRLAPYTRYKSRVLDHLIVNKEGEYISNPQMLKVPKPVFEVLSVLLDEENPSTPAFQLNAVGSTFVRYLTCLVDNSGHGEEIFGTLAELNPEAEFVLADFFYLNRDGFCEANRSAEALERYKKNLRKISSSLSETIENYQIDYVNMSFGHGKEKFEESWVRSCQGRTPNKEFFLELQKVLFAEFYEPLFANKNVVFVQAAPYSMRGLVLGADPEFYIDSQSIDNRLVVSGFSEEDPKLPILGSNNTGLLKDLFMKGPWESVDVYINFGVSHTYPYTKGPYPVLMSTEGVGADALFTRPSASSATPVGLSYMNYLKKSRLIEGSGQDLVSNFRKYHQGKLVEPARYKQFEIYRLGRLP